VFYLKTFLSSSPPLLTRKIAAPQAYARCIVLRCGAGLWGGAEVEEKGADFPIDNAAELCYHAVRLL